MSTDSGKIVKHIKENYKRLEEGIVNQLYFGVEHGGTIGSYREKIWKEMFKSIIPKKFVIEQSVFLIDSKGNVSNEVDLAIFDEMYTPYIFQYYNLKFIPIEAVAVVIECKSTSMEKDNLKNWADSISKVKTSSSKNSYARMAQLISCGPAMTQTATRPLRILCCLNEEYKNLLNKQEKIFDVVIRALDKNKKELSVKWDATKKYLFDWYQCLNHAEGQEQKQEKEKKEIKGEEGLKHQDFSKYNVKDGNEELSLMSFNFQLNQILMLLNNPMLFPHLDYVEMFNNFNNTQNEEGSTEDE